MTDATPEPRERLRDALIGLRDHGYQPRHNGRPSCPFCSRFVDDEETHAPGCVLLNLPATPASPPPPDGPTFTAIEMPLGEDWEPVIHSGPLDPVAVIGNVFACTCGFSNPRGYPAVTRMHNLHHALQAEDSAEQSAPADSALRAALLEIRLRAEEGDPRVDWRPAIARIARAALDSKPSADEVVGPNRDGLARIVERALTDWERSFGAGKEGHGRFVADRILEHVGALRFPVPSADSERLRPCVRGTNAAQPIGLTHHWCLTHDHEWLLSESSCAASTIARGGFPASFREALWSDPDPKTPTGAELWGLFKDGLLRPGTSDGDRDFGQRICQIENEAAALDSKPSADSERLRVMEGLSRAYDAVKPEPGMGGPHGGHLGGITRERAATAIDNALGYIAALEATPPDSGSRLPPETDPAPLDVERLAKAFHLAQRWCDGTESSTWRTDSAADQDATALAIHGDDAKAVAREYAALSGEAPSPPTGCPDPEHPDGAYCFGTTGLPSCYPPEVRSPLDYSGEAPSPVAEPPADLEVELAEQQAADDRIDAWIDRQPEWGEHQR
jgi:hypothetical protein